MPVDILMATNNGEKYLRNQILSLQQQTYEDWTLWVRDDGSTDQTTFILRKFAESDGRIKIIEESDGQRLGPGRSFLGLTKYSTADYVIFCDQDDIWFEKKMEILAEFAEKNFDADIPCLVYCDAYGYSDAEGVITTDGIYRNHAKNLREFLFINGGYQGCCMLFNRNMCIMAAEYRANYYYMHDAVVSLLAFCFGKVYFLPKKLMFWRQHQLNVTGSLLDHRSYSKRVFNRNFYVLSSKHYFEHESFYNSYKDDLSEEDQQLFEAYFAFPKETQLRRIYIVLRHGFSIGGNKLKLIFKTIFWKPME